MNGAEGASPGAQLRMVDPSPLPECPEHEDLSGPEALVIIAVLLGSVAMAVIIAMLLCSVAMAWIFARYE